MALLAFQVAHDCNQCLAAYVIKELAQLAWFTLKLAGDTTPRMPALCLATGFVTFLGKWLWDVVEQVLVHTMILRTWTLYLHSSCTLCLGMTVELRVAHDSFRNRQCRASIDRIFIC